VGGGGGGGGGSGRDRRITDYSSPHVVCRVKTPRFLTGARSKARCLLSHALAALSFSLFVSKYDVGESFSFDPICRWRRRRPRRRRRGHARRSGRGAIANKHSTDVESTNRARASSVCMSIHPDGKSCVDLGSSAGFICPSDQAAAAACSAADAPPQSCGTLASNIPQRRQPGLSGQGRATRPLFRTPCEARVEDAARLRYNKPISVHRLGEMPIQSCGQSVSAPRGKAGARLNANTELRAKRVRSAREAIYRIRPIVHWYTTSEQSG